MISVTDKAAEKITNFIQKRGRGLGIKIGVRTTGCSGLAYTLEFMDQEDDVAVECHEVGGVRVYLESRHRPYLAGMTIDYQKKGLNEGFEFVNPNERDRCGCGESFTV